VSHFIICCAQCCCAECRYAKCRYAKCRYAKGHYAKCHYDKCHYAECRYAECRGPIFKLIFLKFPAFVSQVICFNNSIGLHHQANLSQSLNLLQNTKIADNLKSF
jgi:hypothetical protein